MIFPLKSSKQFCKQVRICNENWAFCWLSAVRNNVQDSAESIWVLSHRARSWEVRCPIALSWVKCCTEQTKYKKDGSWQPCGDSPLRLTSTWLPTWPTSRASSKAVPSSASLTWRMATCRSPWSSQRSPRPPLSPPFGLFDLNAGMTFCIFKPRL